MTTRTGIATHGLVSTTPRGEVHVHGTNALQRDLFLTPEKARSLAFALLAEAEEAEWGALKHIEVWPDKTGFNDYPEHTQAIINKSIREYEQGKFVDVDWNEIERPD